MRQRSPSRRRPWGCNLENLFHHRGTELKSKGNASRSFLYYVIPNEEQIVTRLKHRFSLCLCVSVVNIF